MAAAIFPDEVWEYVFSFVEGNVDRNAISLVCRGWYGIERRCRRRIFVGNCYAVLSEMVFRRFPDVRAVSIKGKPHFADFSLVPSDWGGGARLWVEALVEACPQLEEIRLKRILVTDHCLELIWRSFRNFKVLSLTSCEGFSSAGLASVAKNCRNLRELDLQESVIEDNCSNWLSHFPESFSSLTSLNTSCLIGDVNLPVLKRLVSRCSNLKTLRLNYMVPLDWLVSILVKVPQLVDLGTGRVDSRPDILTKLESLFAGCKNLKSLSGFYEPVPVYLPTIFSVCDGLSSLNFSYATMSSAALAKLITRCKNLERLWVPNHPLFVLLISPTPLRYVLELIKPIECHGFDKRCLPRSSGIILQASQAASSFPIHSIWCRKLLSHRAGARERVYRLPDASLRALLLSTDDERCSYHCCYEQSQFDVFSPPHTLDYLTRQPLDAGFSAIVEACKDFRRLSVTGRLTDRVFKSIGAHADQVKMLSVAFAEDSDVGLHYILSGCKSLKKLEIRDYPFGDEALLANTAKLETMRSLWMSSCSVSLGVCRLLAERMPRLNAEVIDERRGGQMELRPDDCPVEKLYIYRMVAGPRSDTLSSVWTI